MNSIDWSFDGGGMVSDCAAPKDYTNRVDFWVILINLLFLFDSLGPVVCVLRLKTLAFHFPSCKAVVSTSAWGGSQILGLNLDSAPSCLGSWHCPRGLCEFGPETCHWTRNVIVNSPGGGHSATVTRLRTSENSLQWSFLPLRSKWQVLLHSLYCWIISGGVGGVPTFSKQICSGAQLTCKFVISWKEPQCPLLVKDKAATGVRGGRTQRWKLEVVCV